LVVRGWWCAVGALLLAAVSAQAQTSAPGPSKVEGPSKVQGPSLVSPGKADPIQRVADLIAKSMGTYKQIALGVWETTYKGKNMPVIRVRIAAAQDGVFFIVPLFPRDKLALSQAFLLRVAEFNAEYDFVKLALDKASLNLRLDSYAPLLDLAAFSALEGQTALAADEAYVLIRNLLPPASP
jgi:hypothetical protein